VPPGGFEGGSERDGVGDRSSGSHVNLFYQQPVSPLRGADGSCILFQNFQA